jgi:LmbE family N-acetylglucosaminyl deacetylase
MSVLIVAAHPDDELLGCGGTIARASATTPVDIVILGEGVTSRHDRPEQAEPAALASVHAEAKEVGRLLGARSVHLEGMPDNRFDELPLLQVIKRIERFVSDLRPAVIYTHHPGDLNIDHLVTFRAVMTAARPMSGCPVRDIYCFEVASSTEWAFQQLQPSFTPNVFVDVSDTIEKKVRGMALYESEVRTFPHPRSGEALRVQARRWGTVVGLQYAEAFQLVRSIRG